MSNTKQNAIDFCAKWGVTVKTIPHEEFLKSELDLPCKVIDIKIQKNLMLSELRGLKYFLDKISTFDNIKYIFDNTVYFSDKFEGNFESALLHELCHILLKVKPNMINEFESPLTILWYKFCLYNNINCKFTNNLDEQNMFIETLKKSFYINFKSFKEYSEYQSSVLIKHGIFDKNLNPTFDSTKVIPESNWYR